MDEVEKCRETVKNLAVQGLDKAYLKEALQAQGFSKDAISKASSDFDRYLEEQKTISESEKKKDPSIKVPLYHKIIYYLFRYSFEIFISVFAIALALFAYLYPEYRGQVLMFLAQGVPKVMIFAIVLKMAIELVMNTAVRISWKKAVMLGIAFALIPTDLATLTTFWWISIFSIVILTPIVAAVSAIQLKESFIIVILAYLISLAYTLTVFDNIFMLHIGT